MKPRITFDDKDTLNSLCDINFAFRTGTDLDWYAPYRVPVYKAPVRGGKD